MRKILVVAYSYTGTARCLAQMLCAQQGWPMAEVVDVRPRSGFQGTARCVLDSMLRRAPPIRYEGPDPAGFDTVVLVAPIWMYRLAGPMRSFVAEHASSLPQVALLCTMGSAGAVNAVAEIGALLHRPPLLSLACTQRQVQDGSCAATLRTLGTALQPGSAQESPGRPTSWSPRAA